MQRTESDTNSAVYVPTSGILDSQTHIVGSEGVRNPDDETRSALGSYTRRLHHEQSPTKVSQDS